MSNETSTNGHLIDARPILAALRAVGQGDFNTRLPLDWTGPAGEVAGAFNHALDLLDRSTREIDRVSEVVGRQGKISHRATLPGASGGWAVRIESFNNLIGALVRPTAEVSRVIGGVAKGDLSERMALEFDDSELVKKPTVCYTTGG
jgi:methyl-accepting chemotaxis protein